jgi:hypothetical protein
MNKTLAEKWNTHFNERADNGPRITNGLSNRYRSVQLDKRWMCARCGNQWEAY